MKIFNVNNFLTHEGFDRLIDLGFSPRQDNCGRDVHKWLMEEKKILVLVELKTAGDFGFVIYTPNKPELCAGQPWVRNSYFQQHFATYEQALCAGINEGVELVEKM